MKKLTFADGSTGYRDKGLWLEVEGNPVVAASPSLVGLQDIAPPSAPIEEPEPKQYDDTKPTLIKDDPDAADSRRSLR